MSKIVTVGATAVFACILCATPLSLRLSPEGNVALSVDSASARIGHPLTATSVAGVNRRVHRRAYRRGYYGNYGYGYGTYQPSYGYGYASGNRYRYYQQPYNGYGNRQWWQF
jgi:hypothetical protein